MKIKSYNTQVSIIAGMLEAILNYPEWVSDNDITLATQLVKKRASRKGLTHNIIERVCKSYADRINAIAQLKGRI